MRTATAHIPTASPRPTRPHLTLVPDSAPRSQAPARQRLAALLSGLTTGFVLAAIAAVWGGGSPATAIALVQVCGAALAVTLVYARIITVRSRRRRGRRRARTAPVPVTPNDLSRAA